MIPQINRIVNNSVPTVQAMDLGNFWRNPLWSLLRSLLRGEFQR